MKLALEFRAGIPWVNNLQTALAVVGAADQPNLGVVLDLWHFALGPSKSEDLQLLDLSKLFLVQVSDLAATTRELADDTDRILPGEGELPLAGWLGTIGQMGYSGPVSLEVPNPRLWQVPQAQVADLGWQSLARLLASSRRAS
jgi:4-hydroxyphenylpyruvate dioxygenase